MLHAKELRFGNKVINKKGEVLTVQQIHCNTIVYDTAINVSRRHLSKVSGLYNSSYTTQVTEVVKEAEMQEIEPIALTPQILEKCGFRNFIRGADSYGHQFWADPNRTAFLRADGRQQRRVYRSARHVHGHVFGGEQ